VTLRCGAGAPFSVTPGRRHRINSLTREAPRQ
jgi:hypothetical protein